jgi:hypothetical protein
MIETIHVDPKLEKCLSVLRRGSHRACLAADRTEAIIAELKRGHTPPGEICSFTRKGEARIKGCRKFNLGSGYRLVTLKQGDDLYLLFAGTHDECSRWIDNNRDHLPLEMIAERSTTIKRPDLENARSSLPSPSRQHPDPDEDWMAPISDKDLRMVFSGLVEGN